MTKCTHVLYNGGKGCTCIEQDAIREELLVALEPFAGIGPNLPPLLYALYDGAIIRAQHAIAKARGA